MKEMLIRLAVSVVLFVGLICLTAQQAEAKQVTLVEAGKPQCVVIVTPGTMSWEGDSKALNRWNPHHEEPERLRRLQRDSIKDLVHYLEKMSGAKVEVLDKLPAGDKRVPIYVGAAGQAVFGPVGKTMAGKFAFRVAAGDKGVGLYGESEYGTSYAVYELLDRLGCRWYTPGELGEVIPQSQTVTVAYGDEALAPVTEWRRMENRTGDDDFCRRNRMGGTNHGGNIINAAHILENYITPEQRAANPDWCLHVDGKPHARYLRWTRQDVADAIGDAIIARLDKEYTATVSLSPGDYVVPTEDPEEMKHDPTPRVWEPAANQWSVTDRLIMLCNRVAERVTKKYPDVKFGVLVYVNYSMPPAKHKVHPSVVPMIAPIDFNRHHPMNWPDHPDKFALLDMVKGWAKAAPGFAYYAYGMNLAELSAPNPFITKWSTDIPIIMENGCRYWAPETMGGWESMMPGFYLSMKLTFDPTLKPEKILEEMFDRFYGAAAEPMKRYWYGIDRAWIDAKEYSGCGFGYLKIFTPEVMKNAREAINEALAKCRTITEYKRVQMIDESFAVFEHFMKMRRDWADGRIRNMANDLDQWRASVRYLRTRYKEQFVLGGLTLDYVNWYWGAPYEDASRMFKEYTPLGAPALKWKYHFDKEAKAEELGWTKPDFDDKAWKTTHVVEETWSTLGLHQSMGWMAYRTKMGFNQIPEGKKVYLWIGSTDGSAKVFVNGHHVKYVVPEKTRKHEKGEVLDSFSGYCQPAVFDITPYAKPGQNQVTILCQRTWLNELGTGGLMGPVIVFREK